jgi:predicted ATPase
MNLLIGGNGSGKSTVFEVLKAICDVALGKESLDSKFSSSTLTAWQRVPKQYFELALEIGGDEYEYMLMIEHDKAKKLVRVEKEELYINKQPLLQVERGEAQLFRDDESVGPKYPTDWKRSTLPALNPRNDNKKLTRFKEALRRIVVLKVIPATVIINDDSEQEDDSPAEYFSNFVSWYRYLTRYGNIIADFQNDLKEILEGFSHLQNEKVGIGKDALKFHFQWEGMQKTVSFYLSELSEGQRMLIALYSLFYIPPPSEEDPETAVSEYALFLDEPDNFISLREIQPWLVSLERLVEDGKLQAGIISHHPEVIDYILIPGNRVAQTIAFARDHGTVVRIQKIIPNTEDSLSPSELFARDWL